MLLWKECRLWNDTDLNQLLDLFLMSSVNFSKFLKLI